MEIVVASDQTREELFAEIHHEEEQWAEIIFDKASRFFIITIYSPMTGDHYIFNLTEMQQALDEAKARLVSLGYVEKIVSE